MTMQERSPSSAEGWYALHTKPRNEHMVRQVLGQRGFETYLPVLQVLTVRRPRALRDLPFFARYLFVRLDSGRVAFSALDCMPGVTCVVRFGGQPARVEDQVIDWLRERLAHMDGANYLRGRLLNPGDRLRVTAGPLRDMEAIFDRRLSSAGRAQVFVELLGRLTACQMDLDCLEPVGRP